MPTEGGAIYDTVLKKFISPVPSIQTPTTTQSSTVVIGSISLSANPSTIPADGKSTSIITATVKDTNNNVAPNQTVYFSYGNVTTAVITNPNGNAIITYTSTLPPSVIDVTASVGKITNSTQIKQDIIIIPLVLNKNEINFWGDVVSGDRKIYQYLYTNLPVKEVLIYKGTINPNAVVSPTLNDCSNVDPCFLFNNLLSSPKLIQRSTANFCYKSPCDSTQFGYTMEFIDFFAVDDYVKIWVDVVFDNGEKIGLVSDPWGIGLWKSEIFK